MQEFVEYFGNNIQSSGRSITGKQHRKADANHKYVTADIQQRILGYRLKIGKNDFKNTQIHRHEYGAIHRFDSKFRTHQQKSDNQQYNIESESDDGNGERYKVADNHCQCGGASDRYMAGQHKKIYRAGDNQYAHGYFRQFFYPIPDRHGKNLSYHALNI